MRDADKEFEINEEMRELVIAKIEAQVPSNLKLYVGSSGGISKEEMIQHIKEGDNLGDEIVRSHIMFIRAIARGEVTRALTSVK